MSKRRMKLLVPFSDSVEIQHIAEISRRTPDAVALSFIRDGLIAMREEISERVGVVDEEEDEDDEDIEEDDEDFPEEVAEGRKNSSIKDYLLTLEQHL
jgi:Ran GTPase-activating protein (RanGAP) involved in mRNA processing and transport